MSDLLSAAASQAVAAVSGAAGEPAAGLILDEPVVVLTSARSGSTLLRFMLDAHPALACPAETNVVKTAVQLAGIWRLLGGRSGERAEEADTMEVSRTPDGLPGPAADGLPVEPPAGFPSAAVPGIRSVLDAMFADYLVRHGKRRWCEKSLGTAEVAEAFSRLYPKVKFLCLYRHCMDVVASALEACPWGVSGYGFDPYVSNNPGNNAAALAHYWADHTAAILEYEQAHPAQCLRVHYEDLVTDPQVTADRIFSFLGVAQVPGIGERCFSTEHDRLGAADYKIWATGKIREDSVGRGVQVPAGAIPAPLRGVVNDLLGKLGYTHVGADWNNQAGRPELRPRQAGADFEPPDAGPDPGLDELEELLTARISANLTSSGLLRASGPGQVAITAHSAHGSAGARTWHVDLERGVLTRPRASAAVTGAWQVTGDSHAWLSVLTGQTNLGVALRRGELRCGEIPGAEATNSREDVRLMTIAWLLGLTACRLPPDRLTA
ncbi:MAG: sulfotransferase [Streptosporangiaceae bacterium]|nr:sulfotransferase [Streptosporangiaceae bacterium]MBV9854023.1 sulfotransferase [Streptosporangiaceae bacterium]